ncbi:MAG: cupin domain-containing protein [Janthinobacterium lividum]
MALPIVNETDIPALDLPGRMLRWVVTGETTGAKQCSMAVIEVQPGQKVRPAHSHPNGEEVIYLLSGEGRVWIDGEVGAVKAGTAVLFPQGKPHMLQNTSDELMKVACFFAPATDLNNYVMFEDLGFPD